MSHEADAKVTVYRINDVNRYQTFSLCFNANHHLHGCSTSCALGVRVIVIHGSGLNHILRPLDTFSVGSYLLNQKDTLQLPLYYQICNPYGGLMPPFFFAWWLVLFSGSEL